VDLQALEDRLAINDLFVRYATALDAGDVETIVGCFAEDGSLESPVVGIYKGRDGVREFATRFARLRDGGTQLRHVLSNLAVWLDGDRAHATCYLVTIQTRDGKSMLRPPGRTALGCSSTGSSSKMRRRRWRESDGHCPDAGPYTGNFASLRGTQRRGGSSPEERCLTDWAAAWQAAAAAPRGSWRWHPGTASGAVLRGGLTV
jgi:ketosteroid isomerase-like protein